MPNFSSTSRRLGFERAYVFYDSFVTSANDATVGYIMIGRPTAWANGDNAVAIYDTESSLFDTFNNFMGGKKITGNDIFPVIPRINWTANTVYTQYDDTSNVLFTSANSMYVYSSGGNVYKCIDNANGSLSTIEPANNYTTANGFTTPGDGYTWKYMYKVSPTSKFLTSVWIPAPLSQSESYFGFANNLVAGAISRLILESGGSGYSNTNTTITVFGSGTLGNASVNVHALGNVSSVTLTNRGSGYIRQNARTTILGSGTGANVRMVLSPYGGHGFNPARELGANAVMISVKIGESDSTEGDTISANNDFRQIGLLLRPHKYGEITPISHANANIAISMSTRIVLTSGPSYLKDEVVYQGNAVSNAVFSGDALDVQSNAIECVNRKGTPIPGSLLIGANSGVSRTVVAYTNPYLEMETGDIVYTENRAPVIRTPGQAEWIKIVLTF